MRDDREGGDVALCRGAVDPNYRLLVASTLDPGFGTSQAQGRCEVALMRVREDGINGCPRIEGREKCV